MTRWHWCLPPRSHLFKLAILLASNGSGRARPGRAADNRVGWLGQEKVLRFWPHLVSGLAACPLSADDDQDPVASAAEEIGLQGHVRCVSPSHSSRRLPSFVQRVPGEHRWPRSRPSVCDDLRADPKTLGEICRRDVAKLCRWRCSLRYCTVHRCTSGCCVTASHGAGTDDWRKFWTSTEGAVDVCFSEKLVPFGRHSRPLSWLLRFVGHFRTKQRCMVDVVWNSDEAVDWIVSRRNAYPGHTSCVRWNLWASCCTCYESFGRHSDKGSGEKVMIMISHLVCACARACVCHNVRKVPDANEKHKRHRQHSQYAVAGTMQRIYVVPHSRPVPYSGPRPYKRSKRPL